MVELDGDDGVLQVNDERATRDIVQFVCMNEFDGKNVAHLAKETLAEVPKQFLDYMQANRIRPNESKMAELGDEKFDHSGSEDDDELPDYADYDPQNQPPNFHNFSQPQPYSPQMMSPAPLSSPPPLPQGWILQEDGQGNVWYFNTITQQTQWERPQ